MHEAELVTSCRGIFVRWSRFRTIAFRHVVPPEGDLYVIVGADRVGQ